MREEAIGLQSTIKANQEKRGTNAKDGLTSPKGTNVLAALISGRSTNGGNHAKKMGTAETPTN